MRENYNSRMFVLCILDPLEKLNPEWDTSLSLLRELAGRGHRISIADVQDLRETGTRISVDAISLGANLTAEGPRKRRDIEDFQLILIRKEPPFDDGYRRLTYLLEPVAGRVPVVNDPRGIRNTNEKMGILNFPDWIPETIVSNSADTILLFQQQLDRDLVIKPLYQKGGEGVFLLKRSQKNGRGSLMEATAHGRNSVMAQQFLASGGQAVDKRILLLNGEILTAFEKHPAAGEFRSNLVLGGTAHPTVLTEREKALAKAIRPYLLEQKLTFVGLDVMEGKLLEINVTCPSGLCDAKVLYPGLRLVEAWADFLEGLPQTSGA